MESVIVGRNVRTWSVKFGSSRTKLVPLGMGMCLNSQMLVLIKIGLSLLFSSDYSTSWCLSNWLFNTNSFFNSDIIPENEGRYNMFVIVWGKCSPEKLAWKEMVCGRTCSKDGGQERQL